MKVIEVKKLNKVYKDTAVDVHAVNDISFDIEQGEFTAIVGPSGCGKTTLLNLLGGLDNPSDGEIIINSQNISSFSERQMVDFRMQNIGFVFQAYNLIPVLTAKENVEFIMHLQKRSKKEREERSMQLLNDVGIGDKADVRPSHLSGGQQQRVAVARALASKPQFVLADEPTANLDSKSTETLLDIMEQLNKKENITFIFATHDQRVVKKAHRVITLEDGKISEDKTVK